jgi:hypothetical protein
VGIVHFVALFVLTAEVVRTAVHIASDHAEGTLLSALLLIVSVLAIAFTLSDLVTRFLEFRERPVLSAAAPVILILSGLSFYAGLLYALFWSPSWWWCFGYFVFGGGVLGLSAQAYERLMPPDQDDLFEWAARQEASWSNVRNGGHHPVAQGIRWWMNPHAEVDFSEKIILPPREDGAAGSDSRPPRFSAKRVCAAKPLGASS